MTHENFSSQRTAFSRLIRLELIVDYAELLETFGLEKGKNKIFLVLL